MINNTDFEVYVIHATHSKERKRHTLKEAGTKFSQLNFIHEGDVDSLTPEILSKYFTGERMLKAGPTTSCAIKHIYALEKLVESENQLALIIEDDLFFYKNYELIDVFTSEIKTRELQNFIVSLEDSLQRYVPKSKRKIDQYIYPASKCRGGGCYLVDYNAAQNLLSSIEENKISKPIDLFYNDQARGNFINMSWSHPAIAVQGSINGAMASMIDNKKHGLLRKISYSLTAAYKRLLYNMR
jgi:GR25 family glycosyltransferase involved in LPS biosynthesis